VNSIKLFMTVFMTWTLPLFGAHFINNHQAVTLYPLKQNRASTEQNSSIQYYVDQNGVKYGVTDEIIISLSNKEKAEELFKKYHLTLRKELSDTMMLCKVKERNSTLETANTLSQEEGVKFAHPNFLIKKASRTADTYYDVLWHLKNRIYAGADINVEEAWRYTKGEGVFAAIIDEGIDIDHPDLKANIFGFANYDANPNRDYPANYPASKTGKWHGTACAGLLAAVENDTGVVGVAPAAKLYAVRYSDSDVAKDIEAFYDLMKEGVSVISNSWGSYTNLDAYNEIFKTLATKGRNGKGILLFFASGNDAKDLDEAGVNDESESPWVISIGASTQRDAIADYSNYGSSVDFLAPGGTKGGDLITTDATGEKGYTDWNYNWNFAGTSAAAPIAAGVGVLILSENPSLTRDQVIDILKKTAKKIGDYPYDKNGRNDHAGYGRIDAGKAVALAHRYRLAEAGTRVESKIDAFARRMFESVQKFSN
jgi:subtilisin family serine protease